MHKMLFARNIISPLILSSNYCKNNTKSQTLKVVKFHLQINLRSLFQFTTQIFNKGSDFLPCVL